MSYVLNVLSLWAGVLFLSRTDRTWDIDNFFSFSFSPSVFFFESSLERFVLFEILDVLCPKRPIFEFLNFQFSIFDFSLFDFSPSELLWFFSLFTFLHFTFLHFHFFEFSIFQIWIFEFWIFQIWIFEFFKFEFLNFQFLNFQFLNFEFLNFFNFASWKFLTRPPIRTSDLRLTI